MGLFDAFSDNNERAAARAQKRGLTRGRDQAIAELDRGLGEYHGFADQAYGEYGPYAENSARAAGTYADALGLGGAEGSARARDAFTTGPGYDFMVDEGLRGAERLAARDGMSMSGNLYDELVRRSQGYANQEYGNWLDRLSGLNTQGVQIAGSRAGIRTGQGAAALGVGGQRADYDWSAETGIGNAEAEYQKSKDQSGLNIFDAVMGVGKLAAGW